MAILDELPEAVVDHLQEAMHRANDGVSTWASLSLPGQLASLASLPVRVPVFVLKTSDLFLFLIPCLYAQNVRSFAVFNTLIFNCF